MFLLRDFRLTARARSWDEEKATTVAILPVAFAPAPVGLTVVHAPMLFGWPLPPPPRSTGIIELAGNREKIYGAQSLAGKILISKNLEAELAGTQSQNGTTRGLRTVTASTMIADWSLRGKVRCHRPGCGKGPV